MVVAIMVVGFAAVSVNSASADCTITTTLRAGSVGAEVSCLQTIIGATADGKFGPMTKAAVMAWQAGHGLVADGVVGAMTRAALMGAPTGNFPAGCTSASGFSATTGVACNTGTSAGLPAGCSSTAGYSPLTGTKCDSSTGSSSDGSLEGGAGSITLTAKSTYSNEEVVAGDEDVAVLGFEVEADDESDVEITSAKVEFFNSNTASSRRLEDYADSVSIFMGGEKVGEADADDFSETSNYYSKTIALDGAVIDAGETEVFYVAVTASSNLDSGDIDTDVWGADLISVRFEDADGVTTTEAGSAASADEAGAFERDFDFDDLATSGDLELKLTAASANPDAANVEVDTTATTDVTMLEFTLKAEGSDMTVDAIEMTGTVVGVDDTWADMVSSLSLEMEGDEVDSISAYADAVDDLTGDLHFTNLDLLIDEGDTVNFKVVAKIRAIAAEAGDDTFEQGDTFVVSFPTADLEDADTDVEDANGDAVGAADLTGSAIGEIQTFFSSGVIVDMGTVTYETVTDGADTTQVTYNIPLTVTAFGDTRYLGLSADKEAAVASISASQAFSYAFQDTAAPSTDLMAGTSSSTFTCSADIEATTAYRLDEGDAVTCTLQVILTVPENLATSMRVHVEGVQTYLAAALADGVDELIQSLTPVEDFQTGYKFITS